MIYSFSLRPGKVAIWGSVIELRPDAREHLIKIAGILPEDDECRWWSSDNTHEDFIESGDPWGWAIDFDKMLKEDEYPLTLWFRDPKHAVYFKTLWGGN